MNRNALTVPQAAEFLGISRTSAWRLVRRGLIAYLQLPVGGVRIEQAELDRFRERCLRRAVSSLPTRPRRVTRQEIRVATDAMTARARREALAEIGRGK